MPVTGDTAAAWLRARTGDDPPLDIPRAPAREAAERELSKPAYHEHDPNLLQRALDRFWEWIGNLFDTAAGATPGGPLGLAVIALVVVLLLAGLWWRLGTPSRTPSSTTAALFDDRPRSAAEHRTAADAHAAAQRWNPAVQERMRALVRALEERTLLDPRPGRTADEAAAEAGRTLPDHASRLHAAARSFDDVTYGDRTADEAAYLRLRDLDLDLERAKPSLADTPTSEWAAL
ncbi:membrane protein [Streptomyces spiroverticillatus]|uniref:Membrane protein n=1 Tax=Streptomyces finlayi TaxID=67296 RepID=A0A919CAK7_9ACTN|nr:membrane protein [Streptomyces spiroverticillatus]GHC96228.1 membrane protein [Streptomyces finlayi]